MTNGTSEHEEEAQQPMPEMEFIRAMIRGEIEPIYPPRLEELGLSPAEAERDPKRLIETLCGGDDSQEVETYDGTLGVTVNFVATHEAPVGQLQWNNNLGAIYANPGDVSGARWGSGTLIVDDLFLTAGHCFDQTPNGWTVPRAPGTMNPITPAEIAINMRVNFNYQFDPAGNLRPEQSFAVTQLVEYRLNGIDFAIVRLAGNPGQTFSRTTVATVDAAVGDMLCIIQHPAGLPKRIEAGPLSDFVSNLVRYNDIDTLGGTSGAGILGPAGTIVGVHTNGGCNATMTGHNFGVRISAIHAASPTIQSIVTKLKITDEPIKKIVDEPTPKVKALDEPIKKIVDEPSPKVKFLDDRKDKFADDPKSKRIDDPKDKFIDDPKDKFTDDPSGGHKRFRDPSGGIVDPITLKEVASRAPFILATPHHATMGGRAFPPGSLEAYEQQIRDYQTQLVQIEQAIRQFAAEQSRLEQIYQWMLAQYQAMVQEYSARIARNQGRT